MTDDDSVRDVERRRCDLINAGRIDAVGVLLAGGYRHVHANGAVTDKAGTLDRLRAAPRAIARGDLSVLGGGDVAVVFGEQVSRVVVDGATDRVMRGLVTQVLRREGTAWRFETFQITLVPG